MSEYSCTDIANKLVGMRPGQLRVAAKYGSACIANKQTLTVRDNFQSHADDVYKHMISAGNHVQIISSGAGALGKKDFPLLRDKTNLSIPDKQMFSAAGQPKLMNAWGEAFSKHDITVGQALVTRDNLNLKRENTSRLNYLNLMNSFTLSGCVPIINENDAIATDEISFGDNDMLAVMSAIATGYDLILMNSKEQGFYDRNPDDPQAEHYAVVTEITDAHRAQASSVPVDHISRGGAPSKLEAIDLALKHDVPVILYSGLHDHSLSQVLSGDKLCTVFVPPVILDQVIG